MEIFRWIALGVSWFSLGLSSSSLWFTLRRNRRLAEEYSELSFLYAKAVWEIACLRKQLGQCDGEESKDT